MLGFSCENIFDLLNLCILDTAERGYAVAPAAAFMRLSPLSFRWRYSTGQRVRWPVGRGIGEGEKQAT